MRVFDIEFKDRSDLCIDGCLSGFRRIDGVRSFMRLSEHPQSKARRMFRVTVYDDALQSASTEISKCFDVMSVELPLYERRPLSEKEL